MLAVNTFILSILSIAWSLQHYIVDIVLVYTKYLILSCVAKINVVMVLVDSFNE